METATITKTDGNKMKNRLEKIKEFLKTLDCEHIDLPYFADQDQQSYQDLYEAIDNGQGFNVEIIYYSRAMNFLTENDNSLRESLQLASELGYELNNLSSEILASLLASQNAREDFGKLESQIDEFFEELNQEEEEEEL